MPKKYIATITTYLTPIYSLLFICCASGWCTVGLAQTTFADVPLTDALRKLEHKHGYLFSYREADVADIRITTTLPDERVENVLKQLLSSTNLTFKILDDHYILLHKTAEPSSDKSSSVPLLTGQVRDSLTGQPLTYANVFILNTTVGTFTDAKGRFELRYHYKSQDSLVVSYVGYKPRQYTAKTFAPSASLTTVQMDYLNIEENFVVVTDYLTDGIELHNNNTYNCLRPRQMGSLPGQAEPDVLQSIQFLPGVHTPSGSAAGLSVRGGASDQNLLLWEDISIYHPAHYFGMISAFNPYIIDETEVYRGGFAANYGGRVSSLIHLKSNSQHNPKNQWGAGVNFLNAYLYGRNKSDNQRLRLSYSLRHSINHLWRSPTYNNITQRILQTELFDIPISNRLPPGFDVRNNFKFLDGHLTASYALHAHSTLSIATLVATNNFRSTILNSDQSSRQLDSLKLNNYGLKVKWQQYWHPHIKTTVLAMRSDYAYDYTYDFDVRNSSREDRNGIKNNRICEQQLQINNTYTNARQQQWRAGYHLQQYSVDSQITGRSRGNITDDEDLSNSFAVHTIYADFSSPTNKKIGIEAGMRWNYLSIANRNNNFAEPRLRLWYQPTKYLQLYGNAGRYYQFISQIIEIEGDEASIQTPIWVLGGTKAFPFLNATQYQLGGVWRHRGWLVDLQLYHKTINGLTSLASNFDELTSFRFHIGTADIRGLDVLIKKRWGAWRSWMSYSYARQQHEFPTFFDQTFPATTEQPHQLHLVQTYRIGKFDCSLGWKLTSGTPYSNRRDFQIINHNRQQDGDFVQLVPSGSTFNEERLPLLHQMDLSLQYSQQTDNRKLVVGLSILNIYNRRNIYQRSFFINRKSPEQLRLSYLDRTNLGFTPNAVIRIEW